VSEPRVRPGGDGIAGSAVAADAPPVLEVRDLVTRFRTRTGEVQAVNGISYSLGAGESLGIVGESGSGKSVAALSVMGLVPPPGRVESGQVLLNGRDLLSLTAGEWQGIRGREVAMVFQDPMTSLNPVLTVGHQITEALTWHMGLSDSAARDRAVELLEMVGIPSPGRRVDEHPHQFSGGQRQRILIAMALACEPRVLIADEPTTALDVTIQAQIVELVKELQVRLGMALVWITHDLALVAGMVDRVAVMYAGSIVEEAPARDLYTTPRHPYTMGLLRSMPTLEGQGERLVAIDGTPPDLRRLPPGCTFAPRCRHATPSCQEEAPRLETTRGETAPGGMTPGETARGETAQGIADKPHRVACFRWRELDGSDGATS